MTRNKIEFVKPDQDIIYTPEEREIILQIKSLNDRYKVVLGILYLMIFCLCFIVFRLYQIFNIMG